MAKYNRDTPLPSSDPMFGEKDTKGKSKKKKKTTTRRAGVMTREQAQTYIDAYEKQTGKKYVGARNTGALK